MVSAARSRHGSQARLTKQATIREFVERQQANIRERQEKDEILDATSARAEMFAEKLSKFQVRSYQNNTRMNIKN